MGILYLSIELVFDLAAFIIGCILIFQAKDNYQKFYWGVIVSIIGLVFIWENVGWLTMVADTPDYRLTELLNIEKMLKWYALASIVVLFPTASLCPGYFNHFRLIIFLQPPIITITVGICYLCFNGELTPIYSLDHILPNLNKMDVQLRLVIFLITILLPLLFAVYPVMTRKVYREINRNMYLFIGFMVLFVAIYMLFTLSINEFIFNLFGITAITFTLLFSMLYLRYENPFSYRVQLVSDGVSGYSEPFHPLFRKIEAYMAERHPYTNGKYKIEELADSLDETAICISKAIKNGGFTGFKEYINNLRLEHFKQLAMQNPDKNIKELMFLCGFNSRSAFYRNFSDKFGVTPMQYLENLNNNH